MGRVIAIAVVEVSQRLDDAAFTNDSAGAACGHAIQLRAQGFESAQAGVDLAHLRRRQPIRSAAIGFRVVGEVEQGADRRAVEAELARMADEAEAAQMGL